MVLFVWLLIALSCHVAQLTIIVLYDSIDYHMTLELINKGIVIIVGNPLNAPI